MRAGHRTAASLAAGLLALAVGLGTPAAAKTTTKITMGNWQPGQHFIEGHHNAFGGYIQPTRPTGTKVYLERKTSTGWKVLATSTHTEDHGSTNTFYLPVHQIPFAYYVLKVCVHATQSAAAGCSSTAHYAYGHWRTFANTPVDSHSAGFSVGPVSYQGHPQAAFARWTDTTANGSAVYKLRGQCRDSSIYGLVGNDVTSDPVTFSFSLDGVRAVPPQTANNNGGTPAVSKDLKGVHTLKLTAKAAHPELGSGGHYGFHAKAFCMF